MEDILSWKLTEKYCLTIASAKNATQYKAQLVFLRKSCDTIQIVEHFYEKILRLGRVFSLPLPLIIRLLTYQKLTVMTTNENFKKDVHSLIKGWAKNGRNFNTSLVERLINRYAENEPNEFRDCVACLSIISTQTDIAYDKVREQIHVLLKMNDLM
jgi:hypothetical protein